MTTEDGTWRVATAPLRIEVKVLVGGEPGAKGAGRRISKAAFAQIRAGDLLDPRTAEPLGTPLARIHLASEDCDDKPSDDEHVHILWQQGSDLRFSCVPRDPFRDDQRHRFYRRTLDDELLRELQNLGWRSVALEEASKALDSLSALRREAGRGELAEETEEAEEDTEIYLYASDLPPARRLSYEENRFRERCEADGPYHGLGLKYDSSPEEVERATAAHDEQIRQLEVRRDAFRQSWREAFERLASLEQVYVGL